MSSDCVFPARDRHASKKNYQVGETTRGQRESQTPTGWGGVAPSGAARPHSVGVCHGACPRSVPFPERCGPCLFALPVLVVPRWFLAPVMCCSWCPCSRGCVPLNMHISVPLCCWPPLCPVPSRFPGGGVVEGPGGRRWPIPKGRRSGATGGGFRGCRVGRGPEPRPGGVCPMRSAAWRLPGWRGRGWRGSGRGVPLLCGGAGASLACRLPLRTPSSGGAPAGRVRTTRQGRRGGRWRGPSLGSCSSGGGGRGWRTRVGGVGSRKRGARLAIRRGRGMPIWGGGGLYGGVRGSGSGWSGALGSYSGTSGSGSGESGACRRGIVRSGRARSGSLL